MADNNSDGVRWLPFSLSTLRPQGHKRATSKSSLENSSNSNNNTSTTPSTPSNMFASSSTPPPQHYNPSSSSSTPASEDPPAHLPSFSPRRTESPGERASSSGPGGRTRAATFRRSVHENSKAVGWNERASSPYGASLSPQRREESPRSVPTRSPLATPPPISGSYPFAASLSPPLTPLPRAPTGGTAESTEMERPRAAPTPPKRPPLSGNNMSRTSSANSGRAATGPSTPTGGGGSSIRASSPLRQILSAIHPPAQSDTPHSSTTAKQHQARESNVKSTIRSLNSHITTSTSIPTSSSTTIPPLGPPSHSATSSTRTSASPGLEASLSAAALHMQLRGVAARDSASTVSSGAASTMSLPNLGSSSSGGKAGGPGSSTLSRTASLTSMRAAKMVLLGGGSSPGPGGASSRPGSIRSVRTGTTSRTSAGHHSRKTSTTSSLDSRLTRKLKGNHSSRYSMVSSLKVGLLEDQKAAEALRKKATSPTSPKNKRLSGDHGVSKMTKASPLSPGKKKKKGETMSMLLEDGFFPLEEIVYGSKDGEQVKEVDVEKSKKAKARYSSMAGFKFSMPPRLSFVEGELSMMGSMTEEEDDEDGEEVRLGPPPTMKESSRRGSNKGRSNRRYGSVMAKTPLSQISESDGRESERKNSLERRISPGQLNAIPEGTTTNDSSRRPSTVTPVATQIKLRGGSVVTVNPPECNPWQLTVFIHGPIKLPKPIIMPRKNSVATLDPFQDAIDRMYQEALAIPRRRSDDAVVDDICDFFDEYGYDDVVFKEGEYWFGKGGFEEELDSDGDGEMTPEDFLTPPWDSIGATPVEMMLANGVVENENAWPTGWDKMKSRARKGDERLPRDLNKDTVDAAATRRKSSMAVVGHVSILQSPEKSAVSGGTSSNRISLLPAVEASMLEPPPLKPSRDVSHNRSPQRSDMSRADSNPTSARRKPPLRSDTPAGDSVKELDAESTWVGPGAATAAKEDKSPSVMSKTGEQSIKRKGFFKMKKLVASAQSMLADNKSP